LVLAADFVDSFFGRPAPLADFFTALAAPRGGLTDSAGGALSKGSSPCPSPLEGGGRRPAPLPFFRGAFVMTRLHHEQRA
jgi:hypothetical protein